MVWIWATTGLAGVCAASCWYFVVAFHVLTGGDWRHNPGGRHLMAFTANLGALCTLVVVNRSLGPYPAQRYISLGMFAGLVVQVLWRCVLLHRTQRAESASLRRGYDTGSDDALKHPLAR
jgi:hypothetical protein